VKTLPLDNDWEYIWPGTRRNAATGVVEAAAGLAGLQAWLSATDGGATINAALTKTLAERASLLGEYFAIVDGDVLRSYLAAGGVLTYPKVWECFGDSTNVLYSVERKVSLVRRP
jgi:hypothetical protein